MSTSKIVSLIKAMSGSSGGGGSAEDFIINVNYDAAVYEIPGMAVYSISTTPQEVSEAYSAGRRIVCANKDGKYLSLVGHAEDFNSLLFSGYGLTINCGIGLLDDSGTYAVFYGDYLEGTEYRIKLKGGQTNGVYTYEACKPKSNALLTVDDLLSAISLGRSIYCEAAVERILSYSFVHLPLIYTNYNSSPVNTVEESAIFKFGNECYTVTLTPPANATKDSTYSVSYEILTSESAEVIEDFIIPVTILDRAVSSASIDETINNTDLDDALSQKKRVCCCAYCNGRYIYLPYVGLLSNISNVRYVFSNGSVTIVIGTASPDTTLEIKMIAPALPLFIGAPGGLTRLSLVTVNDDGTLTATHYVDPIS